MPYTTKLREEIALRLKKAREQAGYESAENFCQKNELPAEQYVMHEKGELRIPVSQAMKYSKLLRITLSWLLAGQARAKK